MKQKKTNQRWKAIIAIAVALAFVLSGSATFANFEEIVNKTIASSEVDDVSLQMLDITIDDSIKETVKTSSFDFDWWPMVRHDLGNTGYSTGAAPNTNNVLWKYTTGGAVSSSSPSIVNGMVYFGSNDKNLYCLDETDGTLIWKYTTGDCVRSSPSVVNGRVYFGSVDCNVYCLDAQSGSFIWSYRTSGEIRSSPAVADGKVYIASMDGAYDENLYCLDATNGSKIWECFFTNGIRGTPAVVDGKVYFGGQGGYYTYCLNATNGSLIWRSSGDIGSSGTLAVVDDKVYTIDYQEKHYGFVYCLDATDGSVIWSSAVDGTLSIGPAVANGKVYVSAFDHYGNDNNKVYCLDATDGSVIWRSSVPVSDEIRSAPSVADGKVYFSSCDHNVYCLDESDGTLIWKYYTADRKIYASPSIANGKLFIGSLNGNLYCFGLFQGHDVGIARGGEAPFSGIDSPSTGLFDVITPKVRVQNGGIYNEMNVPVNIQIARVSDSNVEYDETVTVDIDFEETVVATFPDWTPDDIGASDSIQYRVTMCTQLTGDENPANDYETKMIGLYPDDIDWWPMFHHDLNNTGNSTSLGPETNNLLWKYRVGLFGMVDSNPAVVDGRVFFGVNDVNDYNFFCLDAYDGSLIWKYRTGYSIISSPAVVDGRVFFGSEDRYLYCLDAQNGSLIWRYYGVGHFSAAPAVVDDKVYVGSVGHNVYCLNAQNGSLIWMYTLDDNYNIGYSSPAVADGKVYFRVVIGNRGQILCLDAANGSLIWIRYAGKQVYSSPAVADGKVYVGSDDCNLWCLNAQDGRVIWKYRADREIWSSPAVADDKVYFGALGGAVYCLDVSNGSLVWKYRTGYHVLSSPAVADGKVYVGSQDRYLYCLNAMNGSFIWKYKTAYAFHVASPAVADGKVYIGDVDGYLFCFGPPSPNFPPDIPRIPYPRDGATSVDVNVDLSWVGGDPNPGDAVTYDVFFGTMSPPPKVVSNQSGTTHGPRTLESETTYYWKVVSWDNHDVFTEGPIWNFTTLMDTQPPVTTHEFDGTMGENNWYVSDVIVTLTATDDLSGVNYTMYSVDRGEWYRYVDPFVVSDCGEHIVWFYSVDYAGNVEDTNRADFKIDQTDPMIELDVEKIGFRKWLFTADVSDATSDVNRVEFYYDDEILGEVSIAPFEWIYSGPYGENAKTIAYDNAGNSAEDEKPVSHSDQHVVSFLERFIQRFPILEWALSLLPVFSRILNLK